ncbi:MAG: hypothetical protein IRZ32_17345 [Solirubrobacteraceae bacterium]|nr:hypothetical protein [Solirubrobacteraceae bacterium]
MPRRPAATALLLVVAALLAGAAPAAAAEPVMPLSEVRAGMRCTGLSVVRGLEISPFDVEVVDVVPGDPIARQPLILVRVSGPAIDPTGIASGFSGSPVVCDGRIAGAIAYGTGDYGNQLGLATPIEAMLGQPVPEPPGLEPHPAVRRARPLATPIAVGGVARAVVAPFARAAARAGVALTAAPAAPVGDRYGPQALAPGSSVAIGLAGGDVSVGAVGTVTYVDGPRVYALGHAFTGTGRRSLLLQDAWVHTVIDNPLGVDPAVSAKLASPGHDLGAITYDGRDGVTGVLGALPPLTTLRIAARNGATGERRDATAHVADEADVGLPDGASPLPLVAPIAAAQAAYALLDGSPAAQSARMCATIALRELPRPARFCRRYVGRYGGGGNVGGPYVSDLVSALSLIDRFPYGTPHVTAVDVDLTVEPGLRQALLLGVRGPRVLRRGTTATLTLELQRYRGGRFTRRVALRVPRDAPLGPRVVRLTGTGLDGAVTSEEIEIVIGRPEEDDGGESGPRTFAALARRIGAMSGWDGVRVAFRGPGGRGGGRAQRLYRDPQLRISGNASYRALVVGGVSRAGSRR